MAKLEINITNSVLNQVYTGLNLSTKLGLCRTKPGLTIPPYRAHISPVVLVPHFENQ